MSVSYLVYMYGLYVPVFNVPILKVYLFECTRFWKCTQLNVPKKHNKKVLKT